MKTTKDLTSFNKLYTDYRNRFIYFSQTYVHDRTVAEDITADAFLHYWENCDTLSPDTNPPAYILGVIRNKCLNYLQHQRVRETTEEHLRKHAEWELNTRIELLEACNPSELFMTDIQKIVDRTLASLPEQTRRIFTMSRYQNLTYEEIAAQTNLTTKGVEFHISKAIKALRLNLKDYISIIFFLVA